MKGFLLLLISMAVVAAITTGALTIMGVGYAKTIGIIVGIGVPLLICTTREKGKKK